MRCGVCERIDMIKNGTNPYFVAELETGYVVIGDHQYFKGYTVFICKEHYSELSELEPEFQKQFLADMALVGKAVFNTFHPDHVQYELHGKKGTHLLWHYFPRVHGDTPEDEGGPVWWVPKEQMFDNLKRPTKEALADMVSAMRKELHLLQHPEEAEQETKGTQKHVSACLFLFNRFSLIIFSQPNKD